MDSEEMKRRTKLYAIDVAKLTERLTDTQVNRAYKDRSFGPLVLLAQITEHHEGQNQKLILLIN